MNEYKHGDWYCKPANKAESEEIIARAVANGAINTRGWLGNAPNLFYAVLNGCILCRENEEHLSGPQYTIEQVREKFPLLTERQNPTQWNGEGWPPVGTVCEALHTGGWYKCEILKHNTTDVGVKSAACDFGFTLAWSTNFRPLRTEREVWVKAANKAYSETLVGVGYKDAFGAIYDALKSGNLKSPEVKQ